MIPSLKKKEIKCLFSLIIVRYVSLPNSFICIDSFSRTIFILTYASELLFGLSKCCQLSFSGTVHMSIILFVSVNSISLFRMLTTQLL